MAESTVGGAAVAHPLDREVRLLLRVALLLFAYTIGIGILNGLDLVEFSRPQLLSHLHGGTLGWMTLGILAVALWLFGASERSYAGLPRLLAVGAPVAIATYVLTFATTAGGLRPLAGTATLVALVTATAWTYRRARAVTLGVPHLLVLLGLTSSVIGGTFGVVNGLAIAFGWMWVPATFYVAHPGTMEVGFIIPVAMGLAEWGLRGGATEPRVTRAGRAQVALMIAAFAWVLTSILLAQDQLVGLGLVLAIAGLIIFYVRLGRRFRTASPTTRGAIRHAAAGGVFVGVTIVYIFVAIQAAAGDFAAIPRGRLVSFIHLLSVGATTNALLAFVIWLSRRSTPAGVVDDVVFWAVNLGLVGFVTGLTTDTAGLIVASVPIMGGGLLVAIVTHVVALGRGPGAAAPTDPASPSALAS